MKTFLYGCKPWNQEDDAMLVELHAEHCPISEIGRILNRTVESIRNRKKKMKLGRCLKMDPFNIVRRRRRGTKQYIQ